jgi:hypothetical protein
MVNRAFAAAPSGPLKTYAGSTWGDSSIQLITGASSRHNRWRYLVAAGHVPK